MKNLVLLVLVSTFCTAAYSQTKVRLGVGYYGETITHPGITVNGEFDHPLTESWSIPIRVGVGYYIHRNNHQALFLNGESGLRWHIGSRFYTGVGGGLGVMSSWHHSDLGVFQVTPTGAIEQVSSFAGVDFMPSIHAEFGYKLKATHKSIWLRPIVFFQSKVNDTNLLHFAVAIGYTF